MGPRKAKDIIDDDNYWRLYIEETLLNDETWTVKVILIEAAGSEQDRIYLNKFENYAAEEKRFVIKNICKTETIFMINQLGGEKKVKDDNLRVFEEGQMYLKEKKDVPSDIMALIIKHLILKMKEEYIFIKRQKLEVHEGMKKESVAMVNKAEIKEIVNIKNSEPQNSVPPINKQKKGEEEVVLNPVEVDENKKYSTLLRVRGEEWRDKIYIDDYPTDGPSLYVAITGFLDPNLAGWLIKVGVPLTAIVQIRIDLTSKTIPSSLFRATKRGQSQTEVIAEKSIKFWEDLQQLRINKNTCNDFKDTAFIVFTPPYWKSESITGRDERIYDELCYLIYDIQDLTRQHLHYLNNMNIISISGENKLDSYLSLYHKQINGIPFESFSTYLVLDAILQTVCQNESRDNSNSASNSLSNNVFKVVPTYQTNNEEDRLHQSENLVKELISQFSKVESQKKKYKVTNREDHYDYKNIIVLHYGDFCKLSTFHLGNLNLDDIVYSMLFGMPVNKLWQNRDEPTEEIKAKIDFHLNMLLSCFDRDDVETTQLNRLIHILACRKLYNNRSSLKMKHKQSSTIAEFKKNFLKRSILAEPLTKYSSHKCQSSTSVFNSVLTDKDESFEIIADKDDETSTIRFIFDCPDISELVSATEIANQKPNNHIIDEFEFFQDFTGSIAFQVILDAFNKYNCIDCKYCEVTDCFVMMFYNSFDKDGITREEWRCHLPTPLCLQDFFDFVLEEHYDWIRNEEKMYDESIMLRSQSEYEDNKNASALKSCVENSDMELELLIEGSLKYEQMNNVELIDLETSNSKIFSSKKTNTSLSTEDLDLKKSGRKTKSPIISTPKNISHESGPDSHLDLSKKSFVGYDLGDRRVEIFGKDSAYFAKDGTRVTSCYSLTIPMNLEFVNLNVVPGNCNSEFWIHRALGGVNNPNAINICDSFRINTKDHLIFYVKKQFYKKAFPLNPLSGNNTQSLSQEISDVVPELHEMKSYHSLLVTWPNGLITETVHENNSSKISHIKQHYLIPLPLLDEDMRCISLDGEVIIFKSNSEIEILKPDSSYFKITKCEKRIHNEEKSESVHSVINSDKSKKGKDKLNKASSKPSKKVLIEDEKLLNQKPTEYELFIEEFEVIKSNGLRQNWIENNKIDIEKLLIKTATDYTLGEIFSKRMDGTLVLLNKDGLLVVTFPNNTRIITSYVIDDKEIYPEWTEEETAYFINKDVFKSETFTKQKNLEQSNNNSNDSLLSKKLPDVNNKMSCEDGYISIHIVYTIEHCNFTTVTINKYNGKISIKSPNNSCVTIDTENNFDFLLDKQTSAQFDGENLNMKYDANECNECNFCTSCEIKIKSKESSSVPQLRTEWLKMTDLFCNVITVDEEGNINTLEEDMSGEILQKTNPVCSEGLSNLRNINKNPNNDKNTIGCQLKCEETCKAESLKFFILRRDLTCSELIHRATVERYKEDCRRCSWCSVNQYDTFGDNRSIWSILTPIRFNESEKWLMESSLSSKPENLSYKDLKKDTDKGFYHWMRPYRRFQPKPKKPQPVLPDRLPRAFILRTLEQQWNDSQREILKGAKELINAILRYRNLIEAESQTILNIPIKDRRLECERKTDDTVQVIADRIYKELKVRLTDDIQSRSKPMITTKPQPTSDDVFLDEHEEIQEKFQIIEKRQKAVTEVESVEATSPNLKRYWRRRAEEYKEEQFYKYLLREGSVPPYFRNVLGGSIWWDINKATDEAVESAERRNIKCNCDEE